MYEVINKNNIKKMIIYLIAFIIDYLIFSILTTFVSINNIYGIQIVNFICWVLSILFLFFVDHKYFPDLIDEKNSWALFKFFVIRVFGLVFEFVVFFLFFTILHQNCYLIKTIGLVALFLINEIFTTNIANDKKTTEK